MSAKKVFNTEEVVDMVTNSDCDPGALEDSQSEADTSAHESHDEGENSSGRNILDRRENTTYVDRVIRKDSVKRVTAR